MRWKPPIPVSELEQPLNPQERCSADRDGQSTAPTACQQLLCPNTKPCEHVQEPALRRWSRASHRGHQEARWSFSSLQLWHWRSFSAANASLPQAWGWRLAQWGSGSSSRTGRVTGLVQRRTGQRSCLQGSWFTSTSVGCQSPTTSARDGHSNSWCQLHARRHQLPLHLSGLPSVLLGAQQQISRVHSSATVQNIACAAVSATRTLLYSGPFEHTCIRKSALLECTVLCGECASIAV
jgi:hypothetical protein